MKNKIQFNLYVQLALQQEFEKRKFKNPRYSLRSFAGYLGVDPTFLLKVLKGERYLGKLTLSRLSKKKISEDFSVAIDHYLSVKKSDQDLYLRADSPFDKWYDFALWEIVKNLKVKEKIFAVASQMNLTSDQIEESLKKMIAANLIIFNQGEYLSQYKRIEIMAPISKTNMNAIYYEYNRLGLEALSKYGPDERSMTGLNCIFSKRDFPHVVREIHQFRQKIFNFSNKTKKYDSVYHLSLCFFPVAQFDEA